MNWAAASQTVDVPKLLSFLISHKPRSGSKTVINSADYEGRTPLSFAAREGDEAAVVALLSSPSCMVNSLDNSLRSALHWASIQGRAPIVSR